MGEDKVMSTPENFKKAYSSFKSRQHMSKVYTRYILDIYMVYAIHTTGLVMSNLKSCQLSKKQMMLEEVEMHVPSIAFQDTNAFVV